jgi:hypothetical protein
MNQRRQFLSDWISEGQNRIDRGDSKPDTSLMIDARLSKPDTSLMVVKPATSRGRERETGLWTAALR